MTGGLDQREGLVLGVMCVLGWQCQDQFCPTALCARHGPVAGHNSVAFTLTRYGGLFEDGSEAAVDRLDALLGGGAQVEDDKR